MSRDQVTATSLFDDRHRAYMIFHKRPVVHDPPHLVNRIPKSRSQRGLLVNGRDGNIHSEGLIIKWMRLMQLYSKNG